MFSYQIIKIGGLFNMENRLQQLYGKLANHISDMIPIKWWELNFLGDMGKGEMLSAVFYFKETEDGEFIRSFDIPERYNVSEEIFNQLQSDIYLILLELYQCFKDEKQELWDQITLKLNSNGKFKVDFNYDIIAEDEETDSLERDLIWAYKTCGYTSKSDYLNKIIEDYIQRED